MYLNIIAVISHYCDSGTKLENPPSHKLWSTSSVFVLGVNSVLFGKYFWNLLYLAEVQNFSAKVDFMNRNLLVFSGRSSQSFTSKITKILNVELGKLEVTRFSDGELSVDIGDNVRGRDVFIVQSTCNPVNDNLMELLIVMDALKRASAGRITAVIPYFGYARQDRKLKPRVPITAKLVADILTTAGAHRMLTIDLHSGQIMGFFNSPVDNLNALPVILPYVKNKYKNENIAIVSPDAGGVERAREFSKRWPESSLAIIDKRRPEPGKIAEMRVVGDVKDRCCIIVDDMIDTAGTLVKASEVLKKAGASKVIACCTHAVLSGSAMERINEADFEEVIITDTIPLKHAEISPKITVLSVSSLFAEAIRRIHKEDSISSLFS